MKEDLSDMEDIQHPLTRGLRGQRKYGGEKSKRKCPDLKEDIGFRIKRAHPVLSRMKEKIQTARRILVEFHTSDDTEKICKVIRDQIRLSRKERNSSCHWVWQPLWMSEDSETKPFKF